MAFEGSAEHEPCRSSRDRKVEQKGRLGDPQATFVCRAILRREWSRSSSLGTSPARRELLGARGRLSEQSRKSAEYHPLV